MAKVEDCPGFETFGADVKTAREAKRLARKTLAEMVGIEWRYLAKDVYKRQYMNRFVVKSHFDLPCVEIAGVRLVLGKKRKGSTRCV